MYKFIIRDLISDVLGMIGLKLTIAPIIAGMATFIQLIASIGGLILLYVSIKYKVELLKEKRIQNQITKKVLSDQKLQDDEEDN